ncbi:cardiolipin synthase [Lachnospiraceae bacterium NSJ-143]|nr:cardiolipin synthase [Lachnospiraceae bacterium NSJ-143]
MNTWSIIVSVVSAVFVLNVGLAAIMVFFERRSPSSTWAWLFVLFFVPVLGFFVYLIFGRNTGKQKAFGPKILKDEETLYEFVKDRDELRAEVGKQLFSNDGIHLSKSYRHLLDFATLNLNSGSWMTYHNTMKRFTDGNRKFEALIDDIRSAKDFIHMEYYIFRGDSLGKTIVEELAKKAAEGVEVRLMYDYMGNITLPKHFFDKLRDAGGKVSAFIPAFFIRLNYRNHRKIAVIDGKIGYVGGFNIGNEYLGKVKRFGYWRDTHARFEGEVVDQLQIRFMMDWNFCSEDKFFVTDFYYPKKDIKNYLPAQIVSSGPDTKWRNVRNSYFKMINEAEKSIYIETPYFSPDDGIQEALKVAALSGIDVRVIIPANPDHFFVYWASMSYLGELLEAGVRCYQYENGFIHSKTVFVDGIVGTIGTANMDIRSFGLNFEVNSFIFDEEQVSLLERDFMNDLSQCTEITYEAYLKRGKLFKFRESVARLISPML